MKLETRRKIMTAKGRCTDQGHLKGEYSDEWYTPPEIVSAFGKFDLDPCAGPNNHAVRNIRFPAENGLTEKWGGRVWMNPPYLDMQPWLEKFMKHGNGICLVNGRTDTTWFQNLASKADAMLIRRGKISFYRPPPLKRSGVPVASVFFAFGKRNVKALQASGIAGLFFPQPTLLEAAPKSKP